MLEISVKINYMKIYCTKSLLLVLACFYITNSIQAQIQDFNLTQVANLSYTQELNDIWGYVDGTGVEYALVGTETGTSIVSLATPSAPNEVLFIPGATSIWRDLKTWGDYCYVTCDQGKDGLLIIDLSPLPSGTPTFQFWRPELSFNGDTDTLNKAHNLYIDEAGYCYIAGSNISGGEPFIIDVNTIPGSPSYLGATLPVYAHDVYARGDTLWTSDISDGTFSVYDVSNKTNPNILANQSTPRDFCHNAWISDDGQTLFTTDEKSNAWIGSFDVSDLGNIQELDRWRSPNENTIPHNTHTHNDYQVISYYTDGIIILDASKPDNLIEVGRYDTYFAQPETGFYGAWGAYPYLPSGLILVSDINSGLYVLQPTYQRACWLEGIVTNQSTSSPINGVEVNIFNTYEGDDTDLSGNYKTGIGVSGNYDVEYKKPGYIPQIITLSLSNGVITTQNVQLVPATPFTLSGQVVDSLNQSVGIANAIVQFNSTLYDYTVTADGNGYFNLSIFPDSDYEIIAGHWGNHAKVFNLNAIDSSTIPIQIYPLISGYKDEFALDYGWTTFGDASTGHWERGIPDQISHWSGDILPSEGDIIGDIGDYCLITGNNGNGDHGVDDIDNGYTTVMSPAMDLTSAIDPKLNFYYFLSVNNPPDNLDSFVVYMTNGTTYAEIMHTTNPNYQWSGNQVFRITDYISLTNNMRVYFKGNDDSQTAMEILVDMFEITDTVITNNLQVFDNELFSMDCNPNPFTNSINISLAFEINNDNTIPLKIFNSLGQTIEMFKLKQTTQNIELGSDWKAGIYFVSVGTKTIKIIKSN